MNMFSPSTNFMSRWILFSMVSVFLQPYFVLAQSDSQNGNSTADTNSIVSVNKVNSILGLEKIKFDQWTTFLFQDNNESDHSLSETNYAAEIKKLIGKFKSDVELFQNLQSVTKKYNLSSAEDYTTVAKVLLINRQTVRQRKNINFDTKKDTLFLLELMAEEALYVMSERFPDSAKEFSITTSMKTVPVARTGSLRGFQVQVGDVMVSKASGSGSSSFIAFSMNKPSIFSHSTPIWKKDKNSDSPLMSPEAFIEDGVKLRNLKKDYVEGSKTRLYIYRYHSSRQQRNEAVYNTVESYMDLFVDGMNQLTNGKPEEVASYAYDFSMSPFYYGPGGDAPAKQGPKKFLCSAVSYNLYPSMNGDENPYAKKYWSQVNNDRSALFRFIGVNSKAMPSPGDVESNPFYSMVGMRIDISKLEQERIENAIIDVFLQYVKANKNKMETIAEEFKNVGTSAIRKENLQKLVEFKFLTDDKRKQLQAMVEQVPDGVNIKQLMFFYMMNEVATPNLRAQVMQKVMDAKQQKQYMGPQQLRQIVSEFAAPSFESYFQNMKAMLAKFK